MRGFTFFITALIGLHFIRHDLNATTVFQRPFLPQICVALFASHPQLRTVDDVLRGFHNGLLPDFDSNIQEIWFRFYVQFYLEPGHKGRVKQSYVRNVIGTSRRYQNLFGHKKSFRSFQIKSSTAPTLPRDLEKFLREQINMAGQLYSTLFQIDANLGAWKKLLQYQEGSQSTQGQDDFLRLLNGFILPSQRQEIRRHGIILGLRQLYQVLLNIREHLMQSGQDIRPVSQAIVDMIHFIGYRYKEKKAFLRSSLGEEWLSAFEEILSIRESFAKMLGFSSFSMLQEHFQVVLPTGMPPERLFQAKLNGFRDQVARLSQERDQKRNIAKTVRPLSFVEAPLRGCLGHDCSTSDYLSTAYDPNYYYFTLTDEKGVSQGHITIVLGTMSDAFYQNVAFIDKIQNVPHQDLPLMIEAVRQSVLEAGYVLVLPDDLGYLPDGISINEMTYHFVEKSISVQRHLSDSFAFHPHPDNLGHFISPQGFSRADLRLLVYPIAPLEGTLMNSLERGSIQGTWQIQRGSDREAQVLHHHTTTLAQRDKSEHILLVNLFLDFPHLDRGLGSDTSSSSLLIEAIKQLDPSDKTPLLFKAVEMDDQHITRLLLEHGADANAKDKDGKLPLDIANHLEIKDLLFRFSENLSP